MYARVFSYSLILCLCTLICSTKGSNPCENYVSFPHIEKRNVNYKFKDTELPLSDKYINNADEWFGAEGYEVNTHPPPLGEDRCGTTYQIWINDSLPTGTKKSVKVCMVYWMDDCSSSWHIDVKDCGHLYVYHLSNAQVMDSAYCVGKTDPYKPISKYVVKPSVDVKTFTDNAHRSEYKFLCKFAQSNETLLYSIHWYINGAFLMSFPAAQWTPTFEDKHALTEDILKSKGYHFPGFNVQCMVKSSYGKGFPTGQGILSDTKFIGIEIIPKQITIQEGESTEVKLKLSAAFGCAGNNRSCRLDVYAMARDTPDSCDPSAFVQSKCGVTFDSNWQEKKTITIKGLFKPGYNPKVTTMKFFLTTGTVMTHPYWSNYNIGSITVFVKKSKPDATQTFCYAYQDPHMKTFDNMLYEFHYDGVYIMYKHNKFEIEVQMKLQPCRFGNPYVRCPCGLAVRAGKTVYRIDSCAGVPAKIGFVDCSDGKDLIKVMIDGTKYKVKIIADRNII